MTTVFVTNYPRTAVQVFVTLAFLAIGHTWLW